MLQGRRRPRASDYATDRISRELLELGEPCRANYGLFHERKAQLQELRDAAERTGYWLGVTYYEALAGIYKNKLAAEAGARRTFFRNHARRFDAIAKATANQLRIYST